jgi:hypothetical protein
MARRFASGFQINAEKSTRVSSSAGTDILGTSAIIASANGGIVHDGSVNSLLLVSPSAYSEVRKVVFWACFMHVYTGAESSAPVRLRVKPTTSSTSVRTLVSAIINEGTTNFEDTNAGGLWDAAVLTGLSEDVFYPRNSEKENLVQTIQRTDSGEQGTQLVYREFDRFVAGDADFFADWDSIAADGNDDRYVGYTLGVQRVDGGIWNTTISSPNNRPFVLAVGFAVIQAPSTNNRTKIYLPVGNTRGLDEAFGIPGFNTVPAAGGGERVQGFAYHADEWSGSVEARVLYRVGSGLTNSTVTVESLTQAQQGGTQLATQSVVSASSRSLLSRSSDFFSALTDGDFVAARINRNTGTPILIGGFFEIRVTGFNRIPLFFPTGGGLPDPTYIPGGPPTPSTTPQFSNSSALFDPLWFQDMESELFISRRVQGGIYQLGLGSPFQGLSLNANLAVLTDGSGFNATVSPGIGTPGAGFLGASLLDSEITANDPLNLAGKRKITTYYAGGGWELGNDAFGGCLQLVYVTFVPNTEIVDLGPLFDLGAFNPEGCASTSAGLGEPPLLIITNGSTLPQKFNPTAAGTAGEVEDAGIPTPFEGEAPQAVASDAASSPSGGLDLGTYRYRYTFRNCCTGKESDPNTDDIVVDTSGQSPAAQVTFSFAGVRIPGDTQICEICLYRTVEGGDFPIMAKVGCFNIEETTVFVDDLSDDALDFVNDGLSILNAPMPCVPIVVEFRNRLFGMGDIPNLAPAGTVSVEEGSDLVIGNDEVEWTRCLEGKFIKVGSDCRSYEILRVLPPELGESPPIARLRLVDAYEGASDSGLSYEVCGRPNRLYFSEPLEPEYWPAANFLDVEPGDGDRLMGAVSNFDRLVICKRRKTYVLTFRENPGFEVYVPSRISSDIGCIGPRTFAQVESGSVWLADRGLAIYDGRTVMHVPESQAMNDIFVDPDNPNYVRRDRNGRVIEAVGVFYPKAEQYLLLLPTVQTNRGCNMMLVWDVKLKNVTLLKFCQQFLSMVVAKDADGNERVYLGDVNGFVWIYDIGDCDGVGVPNATGTVRGDITLAGVDTATGASFLDDDTAVFIEGGIPGLGGLSGIAGLSGAFGGGDTGLAGVCVYTRKKGASYDDPWTVRTIYAATGTRLFVTPQWGPDVPFDETGENEYEYMIGAIELDLLFKPQNYATDDMSKRDWKQIVVHQVEQFASKLRVDLLPDFSQSDPEAETVVDTVTGETGEGRVFRMDYAKGRQKHPVGRLVHWYMGVRMRNFAPEEPIEVINHVLCVEPRTSK